MTPDITHLPDALDMSMPPAVSLSVIGGTRAGEACMRWLAPMTLSQASRALRGPEGPHLLGQALQWLHQERPAGRDGLRVDPLWHTPLISLRLIGPASAELFRVPAIDGHHPIDELELFGRRLRFRSRGASRPPLKPAPVKTLGDWKEALAEQSDQLSATSRRKYFNWPNAWSDSPMQLFSLRRDGMEDDLANLMLERPRNILSVRRALHAAMIASPERARAAIRTGPCPGGDLSWAHLLAAEQCSAEWESSQRLGRQWLRQWRAQLRRDASRQTTPKGATCTTCGETSTSRGAAPLLPRLGLRRGA